MNRFSKSVLLTILVITMAFALVGCKTAEVTAEPEVVEVATPAVEETTPVAEAPAAETAPAAEAAPAVEEAPAAETAVAEEAAPAVEAEPALEPIVQKYVLLGEEVTVIADVGRAEIYYPAIITYEDGLAALAYATENYGAYLEGVTYELHDGYIVLNDPETWGPAEFQVAAEAVQAYVAQVLGTTMEPVEETAAVEVAEAEKIVKEISLYGYTATIEYADKVATITYPSFITNEEVIAAAQAAYAAYSAYLQGTSLVVDNGTAVMTFQSDVSEADLDAVATILQAELPAYVAAVLGGVPAAAEAAAEAEAEAVAEAVAEPIVKTINLLGYEATIEYADKVATITYPSFITNAEVAQAAKAAYASFSKYLEGTELSINNGTAVLTFPQEITEADVDYAVALLEAQLPAYVATLFPAEEPAEVAVVAEAPAAETAAVEEAPAATETAAAETTAPAATESAPAATTTTTTTTTTPAATTTTTPAATTTTTTTTPAASSTTAAATAATAAAKTAKKTNGGLIAAIVVLGVAACAAVVILLKKKKK